MTPTEKITLALQPYLPEGLAPHIALWTVQEKVRLKIVPPRQAKLGDYRAPHGTKGHRISINGNLNRYAFAITLVHEFAHLYTWKKHGAAVLSHGEEWKGIFKALMAPFLQANIFPENVALELHSYFKQTHAATCRHVGLMKALALHDSEARQQEWVHVDELPEGAHFEMENGMAFVKGACIRKNFLCIEIKTGKKYRVSPIAKARILQK